MLCQRIHLRSTTSFYLPPMKINQLKKVKKVGLKVKKVMKAMKAM